MGRWGSGDGVLGELAPPSMHIGLCFNFELDFFFLRKRGILLGFRGLTALVCGLFPGPCSVHILGQGLQPEPLQLCRCPGVCLSGSSEFLVVWAFAFLKESRISC